MLEFLNPNPNDAITILKNDHQTVKDLFDRFEKAEHRSEKKQIVAEALKELKIHAAIEEEIFYRTVRPQIEKDIMNEADEEHHVAKVLVAELSQMDGSEDHYDAKFTVLSENIRHHIREEEGEMLPKVRGLDIDFEALGARLLARKEQLAKTGVPTTDEERMIAKAGISDSPARISHIKKAGPRKAAKTAKATKRPAKRSAPLKSSRTAKVVKFPKKTAKSGMKAKPQKARKSAVAMKQSAKRTAKRASKRA